VWGELESRAPDKLAFFISRIRREGKIIEPEPDTVVREGDYRRGPDPLGAFDGARRGDRD